MTDDDDGWQLFASTGRVSDYLKYRENSFSVQDEDGFAKADVIADVVKNEIIPPSGGSKTQEKERYERDLYGDGHGFVGNARG